MRISPKQFDEGSIMRLIDGMRDSVRIKKPLGKMQVQKDSFTDDIIKLVSCFDTKLWFLDRD